jgi:hypothetical protein
LGTRAGRDRLGQLSLAGHGMVGILERVEVHQPLHERRDDQNRDPHAIESSRSA